MVSTFDEHDGWDSYSRAALYLLSSPLLWRRVASYIDLPDHSIHFATMFDQPWSTSEALLIRAAWSLYNPTECEDHPALGVLAEKLDDENLERLITAIRIKGGLA